MAPQWAVRRALAGLLLAVAPQALGATPVCGGSSFSTCASVTMTKMLLSNGNVRVRIEVMNQAGLAGTQPATNFTYVGLWGLPETAEYVDSSLVVGGTAVVNDWRLAKRTEADEEKKKDPKLRKDMRGVWLRQNVTEGLRSGQTASFEFDLSGVPIEEISIHDWEIHAEVGSSDCSTNLVARNGTLNEARGDAALCSAVVTPEPASFVLFATGLLGLATLALRRPRGRH